MLRIKSLKITVIKTRGRCEFKYKPGDSITYDGRVLQGKICIEALGAMMPTLCAYYRGANFPWDTKPNKTTFACPDPKNTVVFEINRYWKKK